ncbi:MAG: YciI family protein [Candidatus Zixiibacteriota bacterium]
MNVIAVLFALLLSAGSASDDSARTETDQGSSVTSKISATVQADSASQPPAYEMKRYYMVFLRRGPNWTAERTPEVETISSGHMAHILQMEKDGKLALAGPFLDQKATDALAGIFILDVETVEEAQALAESDPSVKAGRFSVEIIPWLGPSTLADCFNQKPAEQGK